VGPDATRIMVTNGEDNRRREGEGRQRRAEGEVKNEGKIEAADEMVVDRGRSMRTGHGDEENGEDRQSRRASIGR